MPIEIFCIENLNWDNGSYKVPNAIPTVFKDRKTVRKIPSIVNYYGGSIPLTGDHWNWAKYNGVYYFLKRERPLDTTNKDPKKHRWLYFLVRDHWTNSVLLNKIVVKGDIATWNLEKDIEKNINRTSVIIEKPVGLARVCFKSIKSSWRNVLYWAGNRKPITSTFEEVYLTKNTIKTLIQKVNDINKYLTVKPYIYPQRNDLFLFANLNPTYVKSHWKTEVTNRVNKALEELVNRQDAILGRVTFVTGGYNALENHYCFTYDKDSIGQREDTVQINEIDLSNVTDIKRVSWGDLSNITIENLFTLESALLDIELGGRKYEEKNKIYKLSQRNFLPLGRDVLSGKWHPPSYLNNWLNYYPGQKVTLNKSGDNTLNLYYVDQINFFLSWYKGGKDYTFDLQFQDKELIDDLTSDFHKFIKLGFGLLGKWIVDSRFTKPKYFQPYGYLPNWGEPTETAYYNDHWYDLSHKQLKENIKTLTDYRIYYKDPRRYDRDNVEVKLWSVRILPHIPFNVTGDKEKYLWNKFEVSPSYGFLIWQINRPREEWRLFEYLGIDKKNSVQVTTGIKENQLIEEYKEQNNGNKKEWWRRVNSNHPLSKFTGQEEFARLYLDLWQLNFLHFFPDPENSSDYETQQYKCSNDYWFGIKQLLLQPQNCELTRVLNDQNLKDLDNNKVENPWQPELFNDYSKVIEGKLDKLLIKEELKLPQPLEKGDYLISSLEYRWDNYGYRHWTDKTEYVNWIKPQTWEALTWNLLEDFTNINGGTIRDISLEDEIDWKDRDKPQIFLGTDLDGSINYFTCWTFERTHNLSVSPDQYIKEVDGQDHKTIKYYHIKKQRIDSETIKRPDDLLDLIATFYKTIGKRSFANGQDNTILWDQLTVNDLNRPEGNLFDLVGSDWFVFIRGENVHFIYKKTSGSNIASIIEKVESFKFPEDTENKEDELCKYNSEIYKLKELPLIAKINQINTLHYKSYPISIKTKFLFDNSQYDNKPIATVDSVLKDDKTTTFDYYTFQFSSEVDLIDELISLPKKPVTGRAIADQARIDQLRIESQRIALDADLERRQLGLNQEIAEANVRRQEFDLSLEETYKRLNDAMVVAGHATSIAPSILGAIPKVGPALAGIAQGWGNNIARVGIQAGLRYGSKDRFGLPKLADLTAGGFFGNNTTLKNSVWYNSVQPEKARRIEEDKQFKFQEIAFTSYKIDLNHLRRRQDNARTINRLAHEWIKEPVNDAMLHEKWIDKKNVSDFYMTVRYPTGVQLEQLKAYVDEFGIDVDIPDKIITLRAGMAPNVIRLRNIDVEGIVGIENMLDREFLAKRLEAGIKIFSMQESESASSYLESSIYVYDVNKDLEKEIKELKEQIEDLENQQTKDTKETTKLTKFLINKLEDPITDLDKLTKDLKELEDTAREVEANPDKYTAESRKLLNEVKQVLNKRAETARDIDNKQKELTKGKEAAEKRAETAENERDTLREELNNAHNKERNLMNENQTLQNKEKQLQEEKKKLEQEKTKLEGELHKAKEEAGAAAECKPGEATPKNIKDWNYCDFLQKYHELNWDYNELYKFIVKDPSFGFLNYEFINGPIPYLQTAKQIVDDCEALLADNTSLLSYDNNSFRDYLLTDEGANSIRNCKRYFIDCWLQHFETVKGGNNTQRINKHSDYFDKDISITIGPKNWGVGTATRKWDTFRVVWRNAQKAQFCTAGNLREMMMFKESFEDASFWGYVRWQEEKQTPFTSYNQTLYQTQAFYDLKDTYTLGVPLIYTILLINNWMSNSSTLISKLANKHKHTTIFDSFRPSAEEGWHHSWTYKGPSSRLMYVGYVLQFIAWVCEQYNDTSKQIELQDFNEMTEYIGPTKGAYMKHFMAKYSVEEENYRELTEFRLRVMYKVMCEKKTVDEAFTETDEKMHEQNDTDSWTIHKFMQLLESENYRPWRHYENEYGTAVKKIWIKVQNAIDMLESELNQENVYFLEDTATHLKLLLLKRKDEFDYGTDEDWKFVDTIVKPEIVERFLKIDKDKKIEEFEKDCAESWYDQYNRPEAQKYIKENKRTINWKEVQTYDQYDRANYYGLGTPYDTEGLTDINQDYKEAQQRGVQIAINWLRKENGYKINTELDYEDKWKYFPKKIIQIKIIKQVWDKVKELYDTEWPEKKAIWEEDGTIHPDDQERFKEWLSGKLKLKIRSIPKYSDWKIDYDTLLKPMWESIKAGEEYEEGKWTIERKT